jgi:hypothetical protein
MLPATLFIVQISSLNSKRGFVWKPTFTLRDDLVSNGVTGQVVSGFTGDSNV